MNQQMFEEFGAYDQRGREIFAQVTSNPLTQVMIGQGKQYVEAGFNKYFTLGHFKYYFDVNTSYVFNKLKAILFPMSHTSWPRRKIQDENTGQEIYPSPRDDVNAPDLYIPLMAFVTYVLLYGFVMGTAKRFTPEVLASTASKLFAILIGEICLLQLGIYLIPTASVPTLDLVAYCGYIYVSIVVSAVIDLFFGKVVFYVASIIFGLFMGIFMVRTLRVRLIPVSSETDPSIRPPSNNKRNYFLMLIGILQIALVYFFGNVRSV